MDIAFSKSVSNICTKKPSFFRRKRALTPSMRTYRVSSSFPKTLICPSLSREYVPSFWSAMKPYFRFLFFFVWRTCRDLPHLVFASFSLCRQVFFPSVQERSTPCEGRWLSSPRFGADADDVAVGMASFAGRLSCGHV